MNTCANCIHWRIVDVGSGRSVRGIDGTVKNCTALPPRTDFHWPRTEERHTCGQWSDGKASGEGRGARGERPEAGRQAEQRIDTGQLPAPSPMPAPPRAKRGQAKAEPTQKEML